MSQTAGLLSRRALVQSIALIAAGAAVSPARAATMPTMVVHRDPGCGCCEAWFAQARARGFAATLVNEADMTAIKSRLGVPAQLASCHTAVVGGYVVEGHVPLADIERLLAERPRLRGLAVPGMPVGAPGMEVPGQRAQPFQVIAFAADGRRSIWSRHG